MPTIDLIFVTTNLVVTTINLVAPAVMMAVPAVIHCLPAVLLDVTVEQVALVNSNRNDPVVDELLLDDSRRPCLNTKNVGIECRESRGIRAAENPHAP